MLKKRTMFCFILTKQQQQRKISACTTWALLQVTLDTKMLQIQQSPQTHDHVCLLHSNGPTVKGKNNRHAHFWWFFNINISWAGKTSVAVSYAPVCPWQNNTTLALLHKSELLLQTVNMSRCSGVKEHQRITDLATKRKPLFWWGHKRLNH